MGEPATVSQSVNFKCGVCGDYIEDGILHICNPRVKQTCSCGHGTKRVETGRVTDMSVRIHHPNCPVHGQMEYEQGRE